MSSYCAGIPMNRRQSRPLGNTLVKCSLIGVNLVGARSCASWFHETEAGHLEPAMATATGGTQGEGSELNKFASARPAPSTVARPSSSSACGAIYQPVRKAMGERERAKGGPMRWTGFVGPSTQTSIACGESLRFDSRSTVGIWMVSRRGSKQTPRP